MAINTNFLGEGLPHFVHLLTPKQREAMIKYFRWPASIVDDPYRLDSNLKYRLALHHEAAEDIRRKKFRQKQIANAQKAKAAGDGA